ALDATGTLKSWNPGTNGDVNALAIIGARVIAGGGFNLVGGRSVNGMAMIDGTSGAAYPWAPPMGTVRSLSVVGSRVYAARGGAALVDTSSSAILWSASTNGFTSAITADASTVYMSGHFANVSGQPRLNFAAMNAATGAVTDWRADSGWNALS